MSTKNPLDDLPKLPVEAMSPCIRCRRQLLETGLPLFYRFTVQRCGIDARPVRRTIGLAEAMGGGTDGLALAHIMGPRNDPIVVMNDWAAVNVCNDCAPKTTADELAMLLLTRDESDEAKAASDAEVAA